MTFRDPVVAGDTLVRPAIQSPNYIPGTSGWTINADGTAEFSDATVRGSLAAGDAVRIDSDGIQVFDTDGSPAVQMGPAFGNFGSGIVVTNDRASIADYSGAQITAGGLDPANGVFLFVASPNTANAPTAASFYMTASNQFGSGEPAVFQLVPEFGPDPMVVDATGCDAVVVETVVFGRFTGVDGSPPTLETWHAVGAAGEPAFASPWSNLGATDRPLAFRRGVEGDVLIGGSVKTSAAVAAGATIFTLPVGYRPDKRELIPVCFNSPAVAALLSVTPDGVVRLINFGGSVTITNLSLGQARIFLTTA